jgi:hypothetical protein
MANIHSSVMQDKIADIDQMSVEQQGTNGLSHIAAGLPARGKARGLQASVKTQD